MRETSVQSYGRRSFRCDPQRKIMNMTLTKTLQHIATSASILMLAVACTGDSGSSGRLRFQDKSGVQTNKVLPAAVSSTVTYNITNTAIQPRNQEIDTATSPDQKIFEIQTVNARRLTIKPLKAGPAKLTARTRTATQ